MAKEQTTVPTGALDSPSVASAKVASAPDTPRAYVGPQPPASISNLPCGCTLPADKLNREQQDFLLATVPAAATWYQS